MYKVFVKHAFDMNDADYVYGCQIIEKEKWEEFKNWAEKQESICVYNSGDTTERPFKQVRLKVINITNEQAQFLTEFGLDDFGMEIPGMSEYEEYLYDLENETEEE